MSIIHGNFFQDPGCLVSINVFEMLFQMDNSLPNFVLSELIIFLKPSPKKMYEFSFDSISPVF